MGYEAEFIYICVFKLCAFLKQQAYTAIWWVSRDKVAHTDEKVKEREREETEKTNDEMKFLRK